MRTFLFIPKSAEALDRGRSQSEGWRPSDQNRLAQCAQSHFFLPAAPDQSTIFRILYNQKKLIIAKTTHGYLARAIKSSFLYTVPAEWVRDMYTRFLAVIRRALRAKACSVIDSHSGRVSTKKNIELSLSIG